MITFIVMVLAAGDLPPQAPPVDPRFTTKIVKPEPLANVTEVCSCGADCVCEDISNCASGECLNGNCHPNATYTFTGSMASGPGVPVLADSPCLNGKCSVKTKQKTRTVTTIKEPAPEVVEGYWETTSFYTERPVRRGLFGRARSCKNGKCR
jgi:hypothetical protein